MSQVDLSGIAYFVPILAFLLTFVVSYAILKKTKILGDENWILILVGFVLATIFVSATSLRQAVENVIPWFAMLVVALFFIMILMAFSQGDVNKMMKPWFGWIFVIVLIVIFLISLMQVYYGVIYPYLPGYSGNVGDPFLLQLKDFFYSSQVLGAFLLLILAAFTAWVITGGKK